MAEVASAYVSLIPSAKGFGSALERQTAPDIDKGGKKLGARFGKAMTAGAILAGAALFKFGKDSVQAFSEAEEAQRSLQFAFQKFPALSNVNIESLRSLNTELQKKTKFDDDNIASGQAVLAQFKLTGQQLKDVTPLLLDYASKTGKDIPQAAQDVGKALLGNAKALKNIGISYKSTGNATKDYANITELMRQKVGGFAETEASTAAGKLAILKNQFGELEETVGSKLLPALTKATDAGLKMVAWIGKNQKVVVPAVAAFATLVTLVVAINAAARAYAATQAALNIVLSANPIGLVVIAIAALAGGVIYAYKHSEKFRSVVQGAFKGVAAAASFMWNGVLKPTFRFIVGAFLTLVGAIIHGAANAFGWVPGLGPKLKSAAAKFDEFRDSVNRALDGTKSKKSVTIITPGMRTAINELATLKYQIDHIPRSVTIGVNNKLATIPGRARGGPVAAGNAYVVGEHRPEVFVPDRPGTIIPSVPHGAGASGGLTVNGNVYGADAQEIVDEQERRERRRAALRPVYA